VSTRAPSVLERIVAETRSELEQRKRRTPPDTLASRARERDPGARRGFAEALRAPGLGVIAEFKRRSPSAGPLRSDPDLDDVLDAYERGGAVAFSILTAGPNFDGDLEDLRRARARHELPILRKDFIVDSYQLHEASEAGADAVLLIVAALTQEELASLHAQARALALDVLVEVHDPEELERALALPGPTIGINNRDLRDFSVDVARTERLIAEIPSGVTVVSESGIKTAGQLRSLREQGVAAVLIGESLMRAADPAAALRELLEGLDESP
jgi:indole-3-glycerol phosphate synthase